MAAEKEKTMMDLVKLVSPGTSLRNVIDDLARSNLGAMIVFDSPELRAANITEGGFKINCKFTAQKLFELCKMDGAIIVSSNLKRILFANVVVNPDLSIHTLETGTRHRAAERTAKQAKTFVIAVSERRNKTTLYVGNHRYYLKSVEEVIRNISSTLQVLEKQRELLDEALANLSVLEVSELVSVSDVCKVVQRAEMILKISGTVKRSFTEIGRDGNVMHMRYRELIKGVEKVESDVLRDYAVIPMKRARTLLSNITFDGLLDLESIARLLMDNSLDVGISPKGYRFLSHLTLTERDISVVVRSFGSLKNLIDAGEQELEAVLRNRAGTIRGEIENLREQILSGKIVY